MTSTLKLELESERLTLHPLATDDVDLAIEMWTNPNVTKYLGGRYSEQELKDEHHIFMRRCGGGCIGIWVLRTKSDGEKIGTAILLPMPVEEDDTNWDLMIGDAIPDSDIEIGYILKETAWGKGYATEACKRLMQFAFEDTPLTELVATTDPENHNSQHVLLKSGMHSLGLIEAYAGKYPGFRITKEQWEENISVA